MTLSPGGTRTQAATGGTTPYIYTSSQPAVATVDAAGLVTARTPGRTVITVSDSATPAAVGSYDVTVTAAFYIDPKAMTLSPGETRTQAATGGTTPYSYTSSQPAVATVDAAGLVTARTPGRTVITVSDSATPAAVGSYDVTVTAAFYIDPKAMTLSPGETRTQAATGGTTPYSYTSSQPAVATVDAAGLVTARTPGRTVITVSDSATPAAVGSYDVTVTAAFYIDPKAMTLSPGETRTQAATGGTTPYSYTSSQPAVATVDAAGLVTARTPGRTVITVSDSATPAAVGSYDVTVTAAFYIDPKAMTLSPGETRTQAATGGTTPYIYTSSQPAIATVDAAGLVTAKVPGQTTITVRDSATPAAVGSYDVTVTAAFYIDPKAMTLSPGETRTQAATGGTTPYSYTSSQPAVATVDAAGLVTARTPGRTVITVRDSATPAAVGSYEVTVKY